MLQADQVLIHGRTGLREGLTWAAPRVEPVVARAANPALQLSVSHDLIEVEREWRRFEQHADCTVFQCFEWLSAWQRHIGSRTHTAPAIVVGRRGTGDPLFILPLATRRVGMVRQLAFLGHDLCDYNAPLLAPDFERVLGADFPNLWDKICATLQDDPRHRHDVILLDKLPERVGGQPNPFLQLDVRLNPSGAYLTSLSGDWETFYAAKRSSATRRRDRTKRKKLGENGEVRMVTPSQPAAVAETLEILFEQKRRSFARMGVADMFARPGWREFFLELATTSPQLAHVSRLEVGSEIAAANFGLDFRSGYYHVLASYDDGPLSRFGPGAAHLHDLMRYALEGGRTFFDFTIGDEPYKRDWCDAELRLYDHVAATTPRGWVVATAMAGARRAKRAIKQSRLWPAVMRLRARVGSVKARLSGGAERAP